MKERLNCLKQICPLILYFVFSPTLVPQEPPVIIFKPSDTDVSYGSTVLLTCIFYGDPIPSIYWLNDTSLIVNSTDIMVYQEVITDWGVTFSRSILEVCSVDLSDEANYSCAANNSVGDEFAFFSLTVFTEGRSGWNICTLIVHYTQTR